MATRSLPHGDQSADEVIAALAPKYVWWPLEGTEAQRKRRILAQIMNLGTYDDILAVEAVIGREVLVDAMAHAEAGGFSPRSWDFWRGRLSLYSDASIAASQPRRSFEADMAEPSRSPRPIPSRS